MTIFDDRLLVIVLIILACSGILCIGLLLVAKIKPYPTPLIEIFPQCFGFYPFNQPMIKAERCCHDCKQQYQCGEFTSLRYRHALYQQYSNNKEF